MIITEQVLTTESWERMKPLGMSLSVASREPMIGQTMEKLLILLDHNSGKNLAVELAIPIFNGNVIQWRNSQKALLFVGQTIADSDFEISMGTRDESERMDFHIISPDEIARRRIEECIADALRNWFYDKSEENVDSHSVQIRIDHWFANGDEWRVLKQSKIARDDQQNGLIVVNPTATTTHSERMLKKIFNNKLWNLIDLNSTSFSDKANESFRFVQDVQVIDGKVIPSEIDAPFCHIIAKHGIGLGMNPRRAYLARNTFEQVLDLVSPEKPIVSPYSDTEENMLHGVNLLTAIMHLDHHTHEDGIVISASAAKKMIAGRIVTQLVESDLPVANLVKVGDPVNPDTPIALDGEKQVIANKLYMPGIVEEINISEGMRFGKKTNRIWFKFRSFYNLENGDKVSNRHGGKGVVTIIKDEDMPWDINLGYIEVCISPESIVNRRAMSALWEMMLTRKAFLEAGCDPEVMSSIYVNLYDVVDGKAVWPSDDNHNFELLADDYSQKSQLVLHGSTLPNETFVSYMFWMRLDKIAKEIVSCVGKRRHKNSFGAVVDSAKGSGQRCNPAKLLAMSGRDLHSLAADTIEYNMSGKRFFRSLIKAVRNENYVKK